MAYTAHLTTNLHTLIFTTKSRTRFRVRETAFPDFSVCGLNVALKNSVKSQKTDFPKIAIRVIAKQRPVCGNVINKRGNPYA